MAESGIFITLEGIEGAGKSTMLDYIADELNAAGRDVLVTREPGGTRAGEQLREILLDNQNDHLADDTELMIIFAARAQHLQEVILPALAAGKTVLCDRFTDASYAYQGGGRGIPVERIGILEDWVQQGLQPDITLLFDLDVAIGLRRAGKRSEADRFEQEHQQFFERVRACYLQRAEKEPERYCIIHSDRPLDEVRQQIRDVLLQRELC